MINWADKMGVDLKPIFNVKYIIPRTYKITVSKSTKSMQVYLW